MHLIHRTLHLRGVGWRWELIKELKQLKCTLCPWYLMDMRFCHGLSINVPWIWTAISGCTGNPREESWLRISFTVRGYKMIHNCMTVHMMYVWFCDFLIGKSNAILWCLCTWCLCLRQWWRLWVLLYCSCCLCTGMHQSWSLCLLEESWYMPWVIKFKHFPTDNIILLKLSLTRCIKTQNMHPKQDGPEILTYTLPMNTTTDMLVFNSSLYFSKKSWGTSKAHVFLGSPRNPVIQCQANNSYLWSPLIVCLWKGLREFQGL